MTKATNLAVSVACERSHAGAASKKWKYQTLPLVSGGIANAGLNYHAIGSMVSSGTKTRDVILYLSANAGNDKGHNYMDTITFKQAVELIDIAANEDRLWHYNGGQAYIRVSNDSNVLMVIDHTMSNRVPSISLNDGAGYFKECAGAQFEYSARLRETPLVTYFKSQFTDIITLETV